MTLSMHQASAPVFTRQLQALSDVLGKAQAHATAQGVDPATLVQARLAPDMFALARQVQIACDAARRGMAGLAGRTAPSVPDTETTIPELQARIADTLAFVDGVPAAEVDGSEGRSIVVKVGPSSEMTFVGQPYLLHFVLPNFFFHVTTAYAILRHVGVPLTKGDFLGMKPG